MFKAALKSLLSRKIRLILSGLAVVLGVMAVSAALILGNTLTKSFDSLFQSVNKTTDVQVTAKSQVKSATGSDAPIPASVVDQLKSVDGAKKVRGSVSVDGARVIGSDGKVLSTGGAPRLGLAWNNDYVASGGLFTFQKGHSPRAPNEVAINSGLAKDGDFKVGDTIPVLTPRAKQNFAVVGVFGLSGGRDSLGGESYVAFTQPVAQQLMMGQSNVYSSIILQADKGVSQTTLKDRVKDRLSSADYDVKTGKEAADDQAQTLNQFIGLFENFLLGFAAVALFVGIFLILNTFSIIVAQRTRELALFRAMGANRRQVINTVLLEAVVIGFIASTIGFVVGIGIAALLKKLMESQNGSSLPGSGLSIPLSAIIASYLVGIVVTVIAALLPAMRASRTPPVAAMRDAADTQRPLTKMTVAGTIIFLLGAAGMGLALTGKVDDQIWVFLLIGVLFVFIGVAMLTPIIARPVVSAIGRLFSWSLPGKLGRRNSARNPRRTAITAAALMIGLALVTGISVVAASLSDSLRSIVSSDVKADLIVGSDSDNNGGARATFDPALLNQVTKLSSVQAAVGLYNDNAKYQGKNIVLGAASDVGKLNKVFKVSTKEGTLRTLKSGEIVIDDAFAKNKHLSVGDTMQIATPRGSPGNFTVVAVYKKSDIMNGSLISVADAQQRFSYPTQPTDGFITLKSGAHVATVQNKVKDLLKNNPEVTVRNQKEFLDQTTGQIDSLLTILYILLGLALIVAILGIVNTLVLSILERTRELGMLRAVGLGRGQTMRMVTVESIVISVFGALLGMLVGCGLGAAIVKALKEQGISTLSFPWTRMIIFLVLAVVVGLFAAIIPAIRASRVNVLRAIAYE